MNPSRLRNIGIVAHIDAGKTTVSERLLYFSGVETRMGEVHEGTAVMDWMPEERRRGITITAAATTLPWRGHSINLIDTPGHVDFTVEVERCLRVLDGAVLVLSAIGGVQAQSEAVWRQARRFGVPTFTFVNQCDREGADFLRAVAELESRLEIEARPIQYPLGSGREFRGLVDLVTRCAYEFDLRGVPRAVPLPPEVHDEAEVLRQELVERLAELDEAVLEEVAAGRDPSAPVLLAALRRATLARAFQPVLCGAALRNVGMQLLLDAVVDLLPAPGDRSPALAVDLASGQSLAVEPDPAAPTCALVFKIHPTRGGPLAVCRVYSGRLRTGQSLYVPRLGEGFTVRRLFRLHADATNEVEVAGPGEIVALEGCGPVVTGDTICDAAPGLALEPQLFSEPVVTQVLEPQRSADRPAIARALVLLAQEDPTLRVREDEETGQWQLSGMGELHLEVLANRLRDEFRVEARFGPTQVAYREAVLTGARGAATVERELQDRWFVGRLELDLEPDPSSGRFEVTWAPGLELAPRLREAVEGALRRASLIGPRFGYPLIHTQVHVRSADSPGGAGAELALDQCASIALREAMQGVNVELLEPMVDLEVTTPAEHAGAVLALLQRQKTRIAELLTEGAWQTIRGRGRLSALQGFATDLRSLSQGRAGFQLRPAGFRIVPSEELASRGFAW
jgi:elongation factor G